MRHKLLFPFTLVLALALAASACSSSDEETVTIYSGRSEDLVGPVLEMFTESTGIAVEVEYGDSADLALTIQEEGDKSPADVFLSQSPGALGYVDELGLLATLDSDVLSLVPTSVQDDDGRWVGVTGRQRVLVYNSNLVSADELPTSIFDLIAPEWNGRIGLAPANGSFQDFVTAMRATEGDDITQGWLEAMAANGTQSFSNNSGIVEAVGRGEVDAGLVNHYYNFRALDENPDHPGVNHQFDADDPGSILIVTGAAVLASSENDNANALVSFLLSDEAQAFFAAETFEYPLANGMEPAGSVPPAEFADVGGIDFDELGGGLEATRSMITESGFEG